MSDDRELKLRCLEMSGGDVERARQMFDWLSGGPTERENEMFERGVNFGKAHSGRQINYFKPSGATLADWKEDTRKSEVYKRGDTVFIAVNEGDLCLTNLVETGYALEAPAQPLDELRSVPGAEEEVRDQICTVDNCDIHPNQLATPNSDSGSPFGPFGDRLQDEGTLKPLPGGAQESRDQSDDWTPTLTDAELTVADLDNLATKATEEERAGLEGEPGGVVYVEPEIDPVDVLNDLVDELVGDVTFGSDTVAMQTYMDGDQVVIREISAEEMYAPPPSDLWQQGYDDRKNGFDPSLAEDEYTKGYEARALIEREHNATLERAKFFEGGMMADADRHAQDQRSIVEKVFDAFKSKEPA